MVKKESIQICLLAVVLSNLFFCSSALSFDDQITHPDLTDKAVESSMLDKYLKTNLALDKGLNAKFPSNTETTVKDLFKKGATDEDDPICRASNHFHNPLLNWDQSYMTDDILTWKGRLVRSRCEEEWPYSERLSNVIWATGYTFPAPNGAKLSMNKQEMNWDDAREYFKLALTESNKTLRENYFAKTFQSIGQVIHLLEDMAVPAHVRNDFTAHLVFREFTDKLEGQGFYDWVASMYGNAFEHYLKNNPGLVSGVSDADVKSLAKSIVTTDAPITRFWDTNTYDGTNPSTSIAQGLSEYTNSNFFSEFTIFAENKDPSDLHSFPHPSKSDTYAELIEVIAEDGQTDHAWYVKKIASNYKLVAYSFVKKWVDSKQAYDEYEPDGEYVYGWEYNLDDEVYRDYAGELLPRAIGYSAGLINYFFRGEIDMIKDDTKPGKYIIENHSAEAMDGTCTLYYDDENENRIAVPGASWTCNIAANREIEVESFTAPTDPKPEKKGEYMLVFEGKLGNEEVAVIGKVVELNDSWSYLLIKQTDFSTDAITYIEESIGSEDAEIIETRINKHAGGHHTSSVKFDLEWLGDGADIINVTFMKYSNYYCYDYSKTITADLNNKNGHSINLVKPTKNTKGFVEFIYNGSENYTTPYPRYILVEAVDQQGKNIKFFEPIFVINSFQKTYEEIMPSFSKNEYVYNTGRDARVSVDARPHNIRCMAKLTGRSSLGAYEIDKSGWVNFRESDRTYYPETSYSSVDISSQRFEIRVGEFNHTPSWKLREDAKEVSVSLPDVTVKINRTWSRNAVTYLESLGYSGIELPEWQLTLNGGI